MAMLTETKKRIVLGSRSPARRRILRGAGLNIEVTHADVDEKRLRGESVDHYALRVAVEKASRVAARYKDAIVITADTVIVRGNKIYGKPVSKADAKKTLRELSGKWHEVHTGTVLLNTKTGKLRKKLIKTRVKFSKLSHEQIDWYISTGEPLGAAGAYSIQGKGRALIEAVDGCFTNVIGISVPYVLKNLSEFPEIYRKKRVLSLRSFPAGDR